LKFNVLVERFRRTAQFEMRNTGTGGRITNTAVLQKAAGLNSGGASKPWIWILQSHDYLKFEIHGSVHRSMTQ
jgi:hypothetical protein